MSDAGDDDGDAGKPDVFKMAREDKLQYLYQVFTHYDKDKSGNIDKDELFKAMRFMKMNISRGVCNALIAEMDEDQSGEVDIEEFLKFFDRVEQFNDMRSIISRNGAVGRMKQKVMALYLIVIFIFTFLVVRLYVTAEEQTAELMVSLILVVSLLVCSFSYIVVFPLVQTTMRGWLAPPVPKEWTDAKKKNVTQIEADAAARDIGGIVDDVPDADDLDEVAVVSWRRRPQIADDTQSAITFELPGELPRSAFGASQAGKSHRSAGRTSQTSQTQLTTTSGQLAITASGTNDDDSEGDERPYRYDHTEIGEITRPHFNPWSQTKARIY